MKMIMLRDGIFLNLGFFVSIFFGGGGGTDSDDTMSDTKSTLHRLKIVNRNEHAN